MKTLRREPLLYTREVVNMYNDYEKTVFLLSENTNNETLQSIRELSLGNRLKLQQLIEEKHRKNGKKV